MINFLVSYFTTYLDLAIFVAAVVFLSPVFLLMGQARVTVLILASYLSYVFYLTFPRKDLFIDLKVGLFLPGTAVMFILGVVVIALFFFFTNFVLGARKKFPLKTLIAGLFLLMLFFSFYFETVAQSYKNFSPFIQFVFFSDYSSIVWRGIPIFLIPFFL